MKNRNLWNNQKKKYMINQEIKIIINNIRILITILWLILHNNLIKSLITLKQENKKIDIVPLLEITIKIMVSMLIK